MSSTPWLKIGDFTLHLQQLPELLDRSGLLVPLFRRIIVEACASSVVVSEEEQLAFQREFLAANRITSEEELHAWLKKNTITEEKASANILESLQLDRFKTERFGPDVSKIFLETKEKRDRVVYSLLRVPDQAAAVELHLRLDEDDATFTDLCSSHSSGPERETGGLIGPAALGNLHPELAEMFRISKPGQLWPPIKIGDWWVVARLDKFFPCQLDEAMEDHIKNECFEQWLQGQVEAFLTSYRETYASPDSLNPKQSSSSPLPSDPSQEIPYLADSSSEVSEFPPQPQLQERISSDDSNLVDDSSIRKPIGSKPFRRLWPFGSS